MNFLSIEFYGMLFICLVMYYLIPVKRRWLVLLTGSLGFYCLISYKALIVFMVICLFSFILGIVIEKKKNNALLFLTIILLILPMICFRLASGIWPERKLPVIVGLSYFTLQIIAYTVDVYKGKIEAEKNLSKYILFVSFFPQIIQGPIPRYEQLQPQLIEGHKFEEEKFIKGFMLIQWGFFLKLMLADKAAVIVNTIFGNYEIYEGMYIVLGGVLYSVQIYADFLAYTTIAQGIAALFGINLVNNFAHPYFSCSIKQFWERWHISLSRWLKDYIYIPLGGNRKRKNINIVLTFLVSGLWHGFNLKYIAWGMIHAGYQIIGEKIYGLVHMEKESRIKRIVKQTGTFMWVTIAWIIFRADTLKQALKMLYSSVSSFNPQILWNGSILELGLDWQEMLILIGSILILIKCSMMQEKYCIRDKIIKQLFVVRLAIYIAVISVIWVFGTYGYEFEAADFIYGGF